MSPLFDRKPKPNAETDKPEKPESAPEINRAEQIRNLSGFNSLDDVAATAEKMVSDSAKGRAAKSRLSPRQKEEAEEAAKAQRRTMALQTLGRFLCRELTVMPYEAWSAFFHDPSLRLSEDEAVKLTEAAFLTVQGFDIDFSSPWVGLTGLFLMHGVAIGGRVKRQIESGAYEKDTEQKTEKPKEEEEEERIN